MKLSQVMAAVACSALIGLAAGSVLAQTSASKAFKEISTDLKTRSATMSPYEYVDYAERAMLDFLKKYPRGPEAAQAHFALGSIYTSIGANENAVLHFNEYLNMPGEKGGPDAIAQAKYLIGTNYMALEKYADAERSLKEILSPGAKVDSRITEAASSDLSRISALKRLKIGAPAIDMSGNSYQGKKIRLLNDYKGKVLLLDFWAAWCNPCRMEMPNVIKVYDEFHKKGFEIVGVSLDKEKAAFHNYIRDNKIEWPQLFDGKYWMSDYAKLYAVNSIPATFLIDRKGIIRYKNVRGEKLREAVQQLLDEK